jgi:hypothetical protein
MLPGLGWRAYASNPSNDFDAVVVLLSFVEIAIGTVSRVLAVGLPALSILVRTISLHICCLFSQVAQVGPRPSFGPSVSCEY